MTRERARTCQAGHPDVETDLIALLWEEAPFPRLPRDAPPELKELVQFVENPRHVYTIHKATRRHNFQTLVERFIAQLRYGCGNPSCTTSSCLSCRKRMAGKAPLRRYNPTSARTLAVYMATQDDPERQLCPYLRIGKDTPVSAMNSLVISPVHPTGDAAFKDPDRQRPSSKGKERRLSADSSRQRNDDQPAHCASDSPGHYGRSRDRSRNPENAQSEQPSASRRSSTTFEVKEQPVRQDTRSFTVNMFGTVAFRMLEWLTPHGLETLTKRVDDLHVPSDQETPRADSPKRPSLSPHQRPASPPSPKSKPADNQNESKAPEAARPVQPARDPATPNKPSAPTKKGSKRRNSNAKVRAPTTKPIRKLSTDPFVPSAAGEEGPPTLVSPRIGGFHEKLPRPPKSQAPNREVSFAPPSPGGSSDDAEVEKGRSASGDEAESGETKDLTDGLGEGESEGEGEESQGSAHADSDNGEPDDITTKPARDQSPSTSDPVVDPLADETDYSLLGDSILPQSLSRLNFEVVEFLFSVLREDSTFESPSLLPRGSSWQPQPGKLKRVSGAPTPYPLPMKLEWKRFVEQSLFYVLSDPHSLVRSFTKDGKLLESSCLWRSMVRLTDAAPSLVFHSLWIASAALFTLPKAFQPAQSPSTRSFPRAPKALTNTEAGYLMSICLHALAATAPEVPSRTHLLDMSRLRSSGSVLSNNAGPRSNSPNLSLKYNDTFSNDLALRLARRLFSALVARKHFVSLAEFDDNVPDTPADSEVLAPLISQMDFLNSDAEIAQNHSPTLQGLPLLLLDWARAVLMQDWDGQPVFNPDSAFGGAMLFLETMYERQQELLLADVNFRVEYLADRLDSASVPVEWLSFVPSRKRQHLLDRPFIFNPANLVSYFRAINLSRMSRGYEEPSSVFERVRRFMSDGLVGHQHRRVLQDMLRRAMSKYLILNISRATPLRDAFDQLWQREERELLRPLKVHLGEDNGEEGFDLGGVQQEFFTLAVGEVFDPNYGAFTVDERTRMAWFVPGSLVETWKFELIGVLFSLAIYNGITIPVTLPKAFYRKLLGEPVSELHHIADGWPELGSGLTMLLEWDESDGAVEDVFSRTYEFSVQAFDVPISRDMQADADRSWPRAALLPGSNRATASEENPVDAPMVTNENRSSYVSDYIKFLTDVSVRPEYTAFERGFKSCLHPKALEMLTPSILQSLVEGTQEIDMMELKRHTRYNGWDASHHTIRDFWSIVRKYDDEMKRRLLEFVTASDRVPVGGMQHVQFVIQKNGEEQAGGRLPTAYTCYGTLLLPEYEDREVLKERLGMALGNAQGFGFA